MNAPPPPPQYHWKEWLPPVVWALRRRGLTRSATARAQRVKRDTGFIGHLPKRLRRSESRLLRASRLSQPNAKLLEVHLPNVSTVVTLSLWCLVLNQPQPTTHLL